MESPGITRGHQKRFPWVPLGSLGFTQLNIIDFTNLRPKMAAFSLKTFRLFYQITTFIKFRVPFIFWLQTLLKDSSKMHQLKGLKPKTKAT